MLTISVSSTLPSRNAGEIDIELSDNHDSTIHIKGSHDATIPVDEKLCLLAVGGNGIDGKIGADGYDGTSGVDGCDAGMYRSGGNGGSGGDGGQGEAGSNGDPAGNGGKVDVWVKYEDLALLDTISSINVSAGIPGKAGRHGAGGPGGRGGRGGASYSWSEPYTAYRTEHWTDADGNSHSHVVSDTHYNYHYSSGGIDGPDGSDGGTHIYPLYPGAVGKVGQIHFHVIQDTSAALHKEPYQLVTRNVCFQSMEEGGLWEPGDVVKAYYGIENTGTTMISPPELIPLVLENKEHLELVQSGEVSGCIQAGTSHFSDSTPLLFRIKEPQSHTGSEPYKLVTAVMVTAQNTRLNQPYQHSGTRNNLTIQYPVLLESQPTQFSIAENESQLLQATIKNIGTKDLGELAGRELFVEITAADTSSSLVSEHISLLEPQNKHQLTYSEQFKPGAEFGEQQTYYMSLFLQPINRSDTKVLIQRQTIIGQLTPKYSPTKNKFTLVINGNTTKEQIKYWTNFLSQLSGNSEVAIWNTSYYQELDLDGSPCLLEDSTHGTVIILDDLFPKNTSNKLQHNTQYITQEQLLKASQQYDVSLVALGTKVLTKPYTHSDVLSWSDPLKEHDSLKLLMAELLHEVDQPMLLHQVTIPLEQGFCRGREKADEALRLVIDNLNKVFPNRTYHVSIAGADEQQLTINVRRLADTLEQNILQIPLSDEELAHPENNHEIIQSGIIAALPFSQKLGLFIQKSNPYHKHLAQAITKDLLDEQNIVMQTEAYGSWLERIVRKNQRDFAVELKRLRQLDNLLEQFVLKGDFENVRIWSPLIIRMIAQVQYHAKQHSSFWTRFIHWFLPQTNEQIIESYDALGNKILDLQSSYSGTPILEIKAFAQSEEEILTLAFQLKIFLKEYDTINSSRCFCFFNKSEISDMERKAVQQLLCVCTEDVALDTLDIYRQTLSESTKLKKFVTKFERLFPEFVSDKITDNLALPN
ncbi:MULTISPECIES: hypothetical protein [Legionella]|uniref:Uncharacterized protein n=1 Tax=Legionella drozanskii LLAP-1 TaxID=1212489 RepID=A0A0W0SWK2_9GAMM|nr:MULTISPECIES: hypothetical protein [Legionella]KTC87629.1 hypothetical protein Ldro_1248 [Legionella drozanskii LLAP-1]PJE12439.1 MAG: hypothetical protein CK430_07515 [Legionella sp.]